MSGLAVPVPVVHLVGVVVTSCSLAAIRELSVLSTSLITPQSVLTVLPYLVDMEAVFALTEAGNLT